MARKRSIYLVKMNPQIAVENGVKYILAPKFSRDVEIINKIRLESEAILREYRNLPFHQKLFVIAENIVCDEFFSKMLDKWDEIKSVFNVKLNLTTEMLQSTRFVNNDDAYSLIYICKAIFLDWERDTITGEYKVSSISFEKMDNIVFTDFYNKCLDLWSYILDVKRKELELS